MAEGNYTSNIDALGFEKPEDFDEQAYEEFMKEYLGTLARRSKRWNSVFSSSNRMKKSRTAKRFIRKGIPSAYRADAWMTISGASRNMNKNKGKFTQYLSSPRKSALLEEIDKDLQRTFPDNIYFKSSAAGDADCQLGYLFNILLAFAVKNPEIGYCQGLNYLAGLILLVVRDEEKSFWLLDTIVNDLLPAGYYTRDLAGLKVDADVFGELVREKYPLVYNVVQGEGVPWLMLCTKWFICMFIDILPTETVLRVWDCIMFEKWKIVFRVALTLVKYGEKDIIACHSMSEIMDAFQNIPKRPELLNCHAFMQDVFKCDLKRSEIQEGRKKHSPGSDKATFNSSRDAVTFK